MPHPSDPERLLARAAWARRLAEKLVRDPDLAEDLCQDAWVAALERREPITHPAAWLAGVLRKLALAARGRDAARRRREQSAARDEAQPSPAELVERAALHRDLVEAVMGLEEPFRGAILLRYLEGLPPRAIARHLDVPVRTVHSRLARGLERLRARLDSRAGGRRSWLPAYLGLARRVRPAAPLIGGIVVTQKSLAVTVLVLALLAVAGARLVALRRPAAAPGESAPAIELAREPGPEANPPEGPAAMRVEVAGADEGSATGVAELDPGRALQGVVVTVDGAPVAGALLRVMHDDARSTGRGPFDEIDRAQPVTLAETRSDAVGSFKIEVEPGPTYDLVAEAPGFARTRCGDVYAGATLRVVLEPSATVLGRVLMAEDGSPIVGARVEGKPGILGSNRTGSVTSVTDDEGRYRLEALPPGCVKLDVVPPEACCTWLSVVLERGQTLECDVRVRHGRTLRGRVVDARTREPIPGARVGLSQTFYRSVSTGAEGRFELPGADGSWAGGEIIDEVRAKAPGYGLGTFVRDRPNADEEVELALEPERRARGRVVDEGGTPVAGVLVAACAWPEKDDWCQAETGADGCFELAGLRRDVRHSLYLRRAGYAATLYDFPEEEGDVELVELHDVPLLQPSRLSGRVVDEQGAPVAGFFVHAEAEELTRDLLRLAPLREGGYRPRPTQVPTDEAGRFTLVDLPPGHYLLYASRKGFAGDADLELDLDVGEAKDDVEIVLSRGLPIAGTLNDPDGRPAVGSTVSVTSEDSLERWTYALTDEHGHFLLEGLAPGPYTVSVDHHLRLDQRAAEGLTEYAWTGIEAGTTDLALVLPEPAVIAGTVVDASGNAVEGSLVSLWGTGFASSDVTDARGGFRFVVAPDAVVDLFVTPRSELPDVGELTQVAGVIAGDEEVLVRLPQER